MFWGYGSKKAKQDVSVSERQWFRKCAMSHCQSNLSAPCYLDPLIHLISKKICMKHILSLFDRYIRKCHLPRTLICRLWFPHRLRHPTAQHFVPRLQPLWPRRLLGPLLDLLQLRVLCLRIGYPIREQHESDYGIGELACFWCTLIHYTIFCMIGRRWNCKLFISRLHDCS